MSLSANWVPWSCLALSLSRAVRTLAGLLPVVTYYSRTRGCAKGHLERQRLLSLPKCITGGETSEGKNHRTFTRSNSSS